MKRLRHYLHILLWKLRSNESRINYFRSRGAIIGNHCDISSDVKFGTEPYLITIGDYVRITSNVRIVTHDGSMWVLRNLGITPQNMDCFGKVRIGNNVNIGWNSIILPNVTIGNNVIIGAGSVITKDIPDNCMVAGVPAVIKKKIAH